VSGDKNTVAAALRLVDRRARHFGVTFKEETPPQERYEFVGVEFDHGVHRTRCKETTLAKLDDAPVTARDFLALFGRLVFAAGANRTPLAKFYFAIKRIRRLSNRLQRFPDEMEQPLSPPPSQAFVASLASRVQLVHEWSPAVGDPKPASATLFTDASEGGWGAVLCFDSGEVYAAGERWSDSEAKCGIAVLECDAVQKALRAFACRLLDVGRLELRVDNTSVEHAIRRGAARSEDLNTALLPVLQKLAKSVPSCRVSVGYVPTGQNPADGPSRSREPGPIPSRNRHTARPIRTSA
jgi:hypothetical protein